MKSKSEVKRVAVQSPLTIAAECVRLMDENQKLRKVITIGLDMLEQMKDQGCPLPGEADTFEDAAKEALNA